MFIAPTAMYNQSNKPIVLDNQNISKAIHRYKITKITDKTSVAPSDIWQTKYSIGTTEVKSSDTYRLQKSTLSQ